jgi:hypothetical protein
MRATRVKLAETGFSRNIARIGKNGKSKKARKRYRRRQGDEYPPISDTILFFSYPRTLASPC